MTSHPVSHDAPRLAVPVDALDHVKGPQHSGPTLIEYGDFECPSCEQAFPAIEMLMNHFQHRVRFVFRHYPLVESHPHAMLAAEAAEAAGAQGRFWEMHDLLFADRLHLSMHDLRRRAQTLELDMLRFDAEMTDHVHLQRVQEHIASGRASHLRGTPGFFVDGVMVDASFGMQRVVEALQRRFDEDEA